MRVPERTIAAHLRRRGVHRAALAADPKVFGRYEAAAPNERWITDVLVGPWVPHPKTGSSFRARLFLIVDDHSRLLVHGRFHRLENTRAGYRRIAAGQTVVLAVSSDQRHHKDKEPRIRPAGQCRQNLEPCSPSVSLSVGGGLKRRVAEVVRVMQSE